MIYYEFWDKVDRCWYLGKMVWYRYLIMKLIVDFYGKDNFLVDDIRRVPKSKIISENEV